MPDRSKDVVVSLLLILVAVVSSYLLTIKPRLSYWSSQNWQSTPCKILAMTVETIQNTKGPNTYRIKTLFSYTVAGHEYISHQYNFSTQSSPSYSSRAAIVTQYPVGTTHICYTNPSNPAEAVLNLDYDSDYLWQSVPLIFLMIGIIALIRIKAGKQAFDNL